MMSCFLDAGSENGDAGSFRTHRSSVDIFGWFYESYDVSDSARVKDSCSAAFLMKQLIRIKEFFCGSLSISDKIFSVDLVQALKT